MKTIITKTAHSATQRSETTELKYNATYKTQTAKIGGISKTNRQQKIVAELMKIGKLANRADEQRETRANKRKK
jgi:hypothetical protein